MSVAGLRRRSGAADGRSFFLHSPTLNHHNPFPHYSDWMVVGTTEERPFWTVRWNFEMSRHERLVQALWDHSRRRLRGVGLPPDSPTTIPPQFLLHESHHPSPTSGRPRSNAGGGSCRECVWFRFLFPVLSCRVGCEGPYTVHSTYGLVTRPRNEKTAREARLTAV